MSADRRGMFYIRKASRSGGVPYSGSSCRRAGVEPGRLYDSRSEAQHDAQLLRRVNAVGWVVEPLEAEADDEHVTTVAPDGRPAVDGTR